MHGIAGTLLAKEVLADGITHGRCPLPQGFKDSDWVCPYIEGGCFLVEYKRNVMRTEKEKKKEKKRAKQQKQAMGSSQKDYMILVAPAISHLAATM